MSFKKLASSFVAAAFVLPMLAAHADVVTVTTAQSEFQPGVLNQGWWTASADDANLTSNDNHYTGAYGSERRSFYTFDLSNVSGTITGATLRVTRGDQSGTVDLSLWDVSTPADVVNNNSGYDSGIFADLGSGNSYGSYVVASGDVSDYLDLTLDAQALNDLRATSGFFTVGASVNAGQGQYIFGVTGGDVTSLVLDVANTSTQVPEPASLAILLAGAGAIAAVRRRRKS